MSKGGKGHLTQPVHVMYSVCRRKGGIQGRRERE